MKLKHKIELLVVVIAVGGAFYFLLAEEDFASKATLTAESTASAQNFGWWGENIEAQEIVMEQDETIASEVILNVPLINQMASPTLYNGCEVTSLAMIMNYWGMDINKNELADALPSVDYQDSAGYYGDPNEAFVGDITGDNPGYFVYHEPIVELAEHFVTEDFEVVDLTGESFETLQEYLSEERPVWVITTTIFAATDDMETWKTRNGSVEISMSEHSVVLTGYDEEYVYLNDPYGTKNYQTDLDDFVASWEQMGAQAVTIVEAAA